MIYVHTSDLHRCVAKCLYIPKNSQIHVLESVWGHYIVKKRRNRLSDCREGDMVLYSTAPFRAQSSYDGKRFACGSMVVGFPTINKDHRKLYQGGNTERSPTIHTFVRS